MTENPYSSPNADTQADVAPAAANSPTLQISVAMLFVAFYLFACGISVWEYTKAAPPFPTVGYVRHAIASAVFAVVSLAAAISLWLRRRGAVWLLLASPILLIVFVFPGLNSVWNFIAGFSPF